MRWPPPGSSACCPRRWRRCTLSRTSAPSSRCPRCRTGSGRPAGALLGALWFEERALFLDEGQSEPRRRFTEAHELMHALCPWHEAVLREDTQDELFRTAVASIEAEANAGAGMLLFQGRHFATRAAAERPSIGAPLALAREYGTSVHAALHHYVATHAAALALLVVGRFPRRDGSLPVWRSVESRRYRRRFDRAAASMPRGLLPDSPLRELVEAVRRGAGPAVAKLPWDGARGGPRRVRAHAHYNRHAFLVLLEPAGRALSRALGERVARPQRPRR